MGGLASPVHRSARLDEGLYAELEPYAFARDYYNEAYRAVELSRFASAVRRMPVSKRAAAARAFYKDYSPSIDRRIAERMLGQYLENVPQEFRPEAFVRTVDSLGGVREFVDDLFGNSLFTAPERFERMTAGDSATAQAAIEADPAFGWPMPSTRCTGIVYSVVTAI